MSKKKITLSMIFNIFVIGICIGLIVYFIFSKDGLKDLMLSSGNYAWEWLIAAVLCHFCNVIIDCILTWQCIKEKYRKFSFMQSVKTAVTGHFFSAVTPGSSGGQPMQIYRLSRMGVDAGFASSVLLQKFLIYQITATVYAAVLFIANHNYILSQIKDSFTVWFVAVGFLMQLSLMAIVILAGLKPKWLKHTVRLFMPLLTKIKGLKYSQKIIRNIDSKINVFRKSNKDFFKKPLRIALYTAEVAIQITLIYSVPYFVYKSLLPNGSGNWITMLCAVAFVSIVSSMLPRPGASGVSELAFSMFFGSFFTGATLKSATLIWRTITFYFTIIIEGPMSIMGKDNSSRLSSKEVREVISKAGKNIEE